MFKTLIGLIRGHADRARALRADRRVLAILDPQRRDAAMELDLAQRALAAATNSDQAEAKRIATLSQRIAGLELRAMTALEGGRSEIAWQAAEAIASLEVTRMSRTEARKALVAEIDRLKRDIAGAEARLADVERGRRIARTVETVKRLRHQADGPAATDGALAQAEATLARLRARQAESEAAAVAREAQNSVALATNIAGVMAVAGFGAKPRPSAEAAFARLSMKAAATRMAG
ncbi:MAG: PspA/IM30 family protein [Phreatobacter sp.]